MSAVWYEGCRLIEAWWRRGETPAQQVLRVGLLLCCGQGGDGAGVDTARNTLLPYAQGAASKTDFSGALMAFLQERLQIASGPAAYRALSLLSEEAGIALDAFAAEHPYLLDPDIPPQHGTTTFASVLAAPSEVRPEGGTGCVFVAPAPPLPAVLPEAGAVVLQDVEEEVACLQIRGRAAQTSTPDTKKRPSVVGSGAGHTVPRRASMRAVPAKGNSSATEATKACVVQGSEVVPDPRGGLHAVVWERRQDWSPPPSPRGAKARREARGASLPADVLGAFMGGLDVLNAPLAPMGDDGALQTMPNEESTVMDVGASPAPSPPASRTEGTEQCSEPVVLPKPATPATPANPRSLDEPGMCGARPTSSSPGDAAVPLVFYHAASSAVGLHRRNSVMPFETDPVRRHTPLQQGARLSLLSLVETPVEQSPVQALRQKEVERGCCGRSRHCAAGRAKGADGVASVGACRHKDWLPALDVAERVLAMLKSTKKKKKEARPERTKERRARRVFTFPTSDALPVLPRTADARAASRGVLLASKAVHVRKLYPGLDPRCRSDVFSMVP